MILRGDLERPKNFVVINADPGMENSETYAYCRSVKTRFAEQGIPYIETRQDLLNGLLTIKAAGATRFDLPPFWTKNRTTGKKGRLLQKCTHWAKIAPMDRALRKWMHETLGISGVSRRLGERVVCKWIGFSADEYMRIKETRQKYAYFDYPLIHLGMKKQDIAQYYVDRGLKLPARSVCNACFANDVDYFKRMHAERPDEFWQQAVAVDEAIRDLRCVGVEDECFVSSTLVPLRVLAERGFVLTGEEWEDREERCHSGHCFV